MALNLPRPVHNYAGQDELRQANGNGAVNGNGNGNGHTEEDIGEYRAPRMSDKYKTGLIYPAKDIRVIVDKTALAVSKSPTPAQLEQKILEHQKADPKFAFLNAEDPYHQYYRYMVEKVKEDAEDAAKGIAKPAAAAAGDKKPGEEEAPTNAYEPRQFEFKVDLPGVTASDLDILRLTALFHARRGRSFLSSLSVREGRNYQFDFLRPTHSLYGYYNRMVESYQKVMQPPPGLIEALVKESADPETKWKTLDEGRNRAEWERSRRKREDAKAKEKDEEAVAYSAIDWQDFVLVETIEFTQNDMELELPPPTSVDKLKSMSMAEKRMASMIMEETGAGPTGGDVHPTPAAAGAADDMEVDMEEEEDEDEEVRLARIKAEQEQARAREVQRAAMESRGMKIKKDYVPKGITRTAPIATAKCPNCGQSIPENELAEHIRIELLDPRWKEQKRELEQRRQQHAQMQVGSDITASMRNFAANRTDIFGDEEDEAQKRTREEEERQKRREREKIIWDGHTASATKTTDTFQSKFNLDDQIKKMHSRIGLTEGPTDGPSVGPQVGPGIPAKATLPPALAASLPMPGGDTAYAGATISAGPTGPSLPSASGSSSSGPAIHPARMAAIAAGEAGQAPPMSGPMTGQTRPAPDSGEHGGPALKRARVDKLPYGQFYSEVDWMSLHPEPVTIQIQLPEQADRPEWKLDGSTIAVPDLPVNTLFSTIRERVRRILDADLPVSRMRFEYQGKVMNNQSSLASVNIDEGDLVVLSLKKK